VGAEDVAEPWRLWPLQPLLRPATDLQASYAVGGFQHVDAKVAKALPLLITQLL